MRPTYDVSQIGVWSFDVTTRQVQWDERAGALFSLPADRPIAGEEILRRIHPEDRRLFQRHLCSALSALPAGTAPGQFRVIWPDGSLHQLQGRGALVLAKDGALPPTHLVGTLLELTAPPAAAETHEPGLKRFQGLVEAVNDWVWEIDRAGIYTYASPGVRSLLGYEPHEVLGRTPFDFMTAQERTRLADTFRELLSTGQPFMALENTNCHKEGHRVVLETSGVPFFDEQGTLLGYRGIDRDISARKRDKEALIRANLELDAFVSTVSHDLRCYLTPIIGYTELLRENCRELLDRQSLQCLDEIESQCHRMLALMEDLLVLAKVGHLPRQAEAVDLDEVVADVLADMRGLMDDAGVSTEKHPLPKAHIAKPLLTLIFHNLIGNAIRYAGSAGSPIEIGGERHAGKVRLYVRDRGPGIPEEERGRIFDAFFRGASGRRMAGTGVGLATVQKICRLYEGRAWVEETPGGGSSFWVELLDIQKPGNQKPSIEAGVAG